MTRTRALRVAAWAALALLALVAVAWLAVPSIVKSQIESRGSALLGRELRVGDVAFAPWALSLTLRGVTLAAAPGSGASAPQLEVARLHVDADMASLWRLAPVIEAIEIDAPKLRVARTGESRYDFDDIVARLQPKEPAKPDAEPARFALFNLKLSDGEVDFDDRPVQRRHSLRALQLGLPFLSNLPADVTVNVEPRLAFTVDGQAVDLKGRSVPFAPDRATAVQLTIADFKLDRLWAYAPPSVPLKPAGGVLGAELALQFSQPPGQTPRVALSGQLSLRDMALRNAAGQPMLAWTSLAVQLADVRPLEHVVALGPVRLEGAEVDVRRDAAGVIEWAALGAGPAPAPAAQEAAPAKAAPWQFSAGPTELASARVRWHDEAVRPVADFALDTLNVSAQRLRWPTQGEVPVQIDARVTAGTQEVALLKVQGEASDRRAALSLQADSLALGAAAPYLAAVLNPALDGRAQLSAKLDWAGGETPRLALTVPSLQVDDLRLTERLTERPPAGRAAGKLAPAVKVRAITVEDAQIDLLARQVSVGMLRVKQPGVVLQRGPDGSLNAAAWPVQAASAPVAAEPKALPGKPAPVPAPWRLNLNDLLLEGGQLTLNDAAVHPGTPVALQVRALRVAVQGLAWPATSAQARFQIAALLPAPGAAAAAPAGRIDARGQFALAPLAVKANATLERLPVHAFEPYFGPLLPVRLQRAELGWRGQVDLKQGAQGLSLNAKGDVLVADLQVNARSAEGSTEPGDELLTWNSLTLKPLSVALAPGSKPRIEIGEIQLTDFYSRLIITEQGRFNLRDVAAVPDAASAPGVAAAPAPAASAPTPGLPIDLVVGGAKLVNGRVDFTDRFVRPSYSAALSALNGSIGRLASGTREMATVDLTGRVAGTGLLEVRGAFNPTAKPLALDITARTTDIELAPFSTYAGKYAGYGIERGKLSLDVAYRIDPDGKLDAKNQLILNQLTFGEATNSPDATKLPVRFAISLLTDRNGVIDLNLPISGSVEDPQFSIWGLVWQIIGNLLVKAVTAPFALLAGSEAADLSLVEFLPGTAQIAPASNANVERVAKSLTDRPALRMTVTGAADPVSERDAMQAAALDARVQAEARRDLARAGNSAPAPAPVVSASAPATEAALPTLSAEDRARYVKRIYADTKLPDKPRNLIGLAKDIPVADMETRLKTATEVSPDSARQLALQRGLAVRDALIARGLPSERLFLGAPKLRTSAEEDAAWTPRVQLTLAGP